MEWIFWAFLIVSMIHMVEEYYYPGGFMDLMKRLNPGFAHWVTGPMAVLINGLQLLVCLVAVAFGKSLLSISMSVAALLFINGLVHIMASIRIRGYAPGVISGVLLYIPFSGYAYYHFTTSGQLRLDGVMVSGLLGLLYQAVPIGYFLLAGAMKKRDLE
jgi:Protein of unknown function with HXXEE motif